MSSFVVALDVGGTSMKGGLVTRSGEIIRTDRRATPRDRGPAAVVATIRSFIDDLATAGGGTPAGVGLAVPGLVTADAALYSANIGWRDVPATDFVPLDVPVILGHDVRTGGLAESVFGAGRELSDFLFLPIGTGIAGAVILHGEPYGGSAGWGGEIGHTPVLPEGEPCACGQIGCLETYASASAVARRYSTRAPSSASSTTIAPASTSTAPASTSTASTSTAPASTAPASTAPASTAPASTAPAFSITASPDTTTTASAASPTAASPATATASPATAASPAPVTAEQVAALTASGDPLAMEIWGEAVEALSPALATYTLLLDPSAIVLGGGLAEAGPLLSVPLAERLQKRLAFRDAPPLRQAALGMSAGMLGAALLGWRAAGFADAGATWSPDVLKSPRVA
ncbi:ROK family protein [Streptosporangium sp. NBC_01755]|uniref:ROK family protein n=1 Tax=Streptosporangium sp. NBC_01755 TaxID=2975949 RepID=UPI002DDC8E41|nr:ROK family protein [Streptosporangium sp. NBC_01755]WSD01238.1 ROK family protein [Streptosporangium sp. NBC_01755]